LKEETFFGGYGEPEKGPPVPWEDLSEARAPAPPHGVDKLGPSNIGCSVTIKRCAERPSIDEKINCYPGRELKNNGSPWEPPSRVIEGPHP